MSFKLEFSIIFGFFGHITNKIILFEDYLNILWGPALTQQVSALIIMNSNKDKHFSETSAIFQSIIFNLIRLD